MERISLGGSPAHHYTSLEGLTGIVEKDDLWLTNALYSNDEEEIEHGYRIARDVVQKEKLDTPANRVYCGHIAEVLKARDLECYICCFCRKGDLLSQWRGYGANGVGVDITVEINQLPALNAVCPYGALYYWKVTYMDGDKQTRIKEAIDYFRPVSNADENQSLVRARQAAEAIRFFIPTFKNQSFAEEDEWRIIFVPSPAHPAGIQAVKPRFRAARNLLIPYHCLSDLVPPVAPPPGKPRIRIREVLVGPNRHNKLTAESVFTLLAQNGHAPVVRHSATPYRG